MRELADLIERESVAQHVKANDPDLVGGWRQTMHREIAETLHRIADDAHAVASRLEAEAEAARADIETAAAHLRAKVLAKPAAADEQPAGEESAKPAARAKAADGAAASK